MQALESWRYQRDQIFTTERNRSAVFGLAISCPYYKTKNDCPLKEIRKMSSRDIYEWLDKMDNDELEKIVDKHHYCFSCRRFE